MDPGKILPDEVFEQILSYLSLKELMSCCLVSRKWNIAANNDTLWKKICLQRKWNDFSIGGKHKDCFGSFKEAFNNMSKWKKHYVFKTQLQNNWRLGNAKDTIVSPIGKNFTGYAIAGTSNGNTFVALEFDKGIVKFFDLKNEGRLVLEKECILEIPVDRIQIIQECVFIVQSCLLQVYKMNTDFTLDLNCIKIIKGSTIMNIDMPTLLALDRSSRYGVLLENNENTIFHFMNYYMIFALPYSSIINVYDLDCDNFNPELKFQLNTGYDCSRIYNVHVRDNYLYVLLGELINPSRTCLHNNIKLIICAYSLRDQSFQHSENLKEHKMKCMPETSTIESNENYLVIVFDLNYFLVDRNTSKLLLKDFDTIFLNACSDPALVAILIDDTLDIFNPKTKEKICCITLDGLPIAMYSNVVATVCIEFSRDLGDSTDIEFWNVHNSSKEIGTLRFPRSSEAVLIFQDDSKLIFYVTEDWCLIRDFLFNIT